MGEHLVTIGGCNDCHTPKKMTPQGPVPDESLMLSGHPEKMPAPDVDRKEMESKGLIVTQDLTAWVGPWGISYAANITPDATGIGSWQESNFITALREGKFKGMTSARNLLPPMPWQLFKEMSDDEIKAIFAYLKSIKPVKNIVPQPEPPVSAPPGK
ncbi:MAG: c-type cytochrome [Ignavibacteria bacterium]|nr:c-type cytochrome [Ignavibacteria bacterium]